MHLARGLTQSGTRPMNASPSVIDTLTHLISIPSVNPNYSGGSGEGEIGQWVFDFFERKNLQVVKQPIETGRFNVIVRIPGRTSNRRIVFEAHLDTVSAEGMTIAPFCPKLEGGRIYGRGACDTKAGLSAMMHAMVELSNQRCDCEVWLAATVDEEYSYRGVAGFCEQHKKFDAAVIAEPTELRAIIASKGLLRCKIITKGTSAHSAKPHLGDNAILQMLPIIERLQLDAHQLQNTHHPLLGHATCNIGVIKGGIQINFVPDHCEIEIDRRLLPHETPFEIWEHYRNLVDEVMEHHPGIQAELLPPLLTDSPLSTDPDDHAVSTISQVLASHHLPAEPGGVPFCSDASKFGNLGIPSLIFGPGSIDQAHAAIEYVECEQVQKAVEIYRDFAINF